MRTSRKRWMTAIEIDGWVAELHWFAEVPLMEQGCDQPPLPPDTVNPWDGSGPLPTQPDGANWEPTRSGSGR